MRLNGGAAVAAVRSVEDCCTRQGMDPPARGESRACRNFLQVSSGRGQVVAVTGVLAILAPRPRRKEDGRAWLYLMVATTLLSVLGPVIGLGVLRDAPDVLAPLATALLALLPVVALGYSFRRPSQT